MSDSVTPLHATEPAVRPVMLFDGECGFCRNSVEWLKQRVGDRVVFEPSQVAGARYPQIPPERFAHAVQLVEPDGRVSEAAEAVFRALAMVRRWAWLLWLYQHVPGFRPVSELAYRFVARHRGALAGGACSIQPRARLQATRWLFLRLLGMCYLIAFASLGSQIVGLVGHNGILPAEQYLRLASDYFGAKRYSEMPTLCWVSCTDAALHGMCTAGAGLSVLLILDIAPAIVLAGLFVLYSSLTPICQVFLHFQWDILLLEAGFLAIWVAPLSLRPRLKSAAEPSKLAIWALRLLAFKLVFCSGVVKLTSGDVTWRNLTAMSYHYMTQPIPSWISWWAYQQPMWLAKATTVATFAAELVAPVLMFFGRRARLVAFFAMAGLQVVIGATGNYGFFNVLSVALCVPLLDDRMLPAFMRRWFEPATPRGWRWPSLIAWPVLVGLVLTSIIPIVDAFDRAAPLPEWAQRWYAQAAGRFHLVGGYGLFRVMTTTRPEIAVEGSADGEHWQAYEFRYKPGPLDRPPPLIGFHMPRLDWQMWFAALGDYRSPNDRWFSLFCRRLLAGSPQVSALLERDPFAGSPPRFIRATLWDYRFTTREERQATGAWWKRERLGLYCPILSRPAAAR